MSIVQNRVPSEPIEYIEDMGGAQAPSIDLLAVLWGVLRRWKLDYRYNAVRVDCNIRRAKAVVPSRYKSTVEILVYDPQRQIDATVQKPISPFVDALGNDAINTEINILKSKSVALRVASELGLDRDPEFQSHDLESRIWRNGFESGGSVATAWNRRSGGTAWFPRPGPSL